MTCLEQSTNCAEVVTQRKSVRSSMFLPYIKLREFRCILKNNIFIIENQRVVAVVVELNSANQLSKTATPVISYSAGYRPISVRHICSL